MKRFGKKALSVSAVGVLALGFAGGTAANGLWKTDADSDYSMKTPYAEMSVKVGDKDPVQIINGDGSLDEFSSWRDYAKYQGKQFNLLDEDDYRKLVKDHKIAVPVTLTATTHGDIGLNEFNWKLFDGVEDANKQSYLDSEYSDSVRYDDGTYYHSIGSRQPLFSKTMMTKNISKRVSNPSQCTVDILDEKGSTSPGITSDEYRVLDRGIEGDFELYNPNEGPLPDGMNSWEGAVPANTTFQRTICVALELPEEEGETGIHENTVKVEGQAEDTGDSVQAEDTWKANVTKRKADYSKELEEQIKLGPVRGSVYFTSSSTPYNSGNFTVDEVKKFWQISDADDSAEELGFTKNNG